VKKASTQIDYDSLNDQQSPTPLLPVLIPEIRQAKIDLSGSEVVEEDVESLCITREGRAAGTCQHEKPKGTNGAKTG
jgi:hypothetical protein